MPPAEPTDREVVNAAVEAAESVVFLRFDRNDIEDVDVTVSFEDGDLAVDVYLHVPDPGLEDPDRVVEDAALAARSAVDDLLGG